MRTAHRKNHDLPLVIAVSVLIFVGLACDLPFLNMNPTQTSSANKTPEPVLVETTKSAPTPEPVQANPTKGAPTPVQTSTVETKNQASCLKGIIPGTTTKAQVIALLGNPVSSQEDGDVEFLFFSSSSKTRLDSISLQNQVVVLVSALVGQANPLKWSEVKAQYGKPAKIGYSDYSEGSMAHIYPDRGVAFIADEAVDQVFIRECFVPMSLEKYMNSWGKYLPIDDPYTQ